MASPFGDPFAMSDPFGASDPFRAPAQPTANPIPPLDPGAEEGILSRLGQTALGGLGYIGGSLAKAFGGRAIKGILGGRPEEIASIIPFSDTLGITNPDNEVSGKSLLGYGEHDDSWGATLGGLAADFFTDPSTYIAPGAKTLLGKAAQKAGVLPKAGVTVGGVFKPGTPVTTRITNNPFAKRFTGQLATEMAGATGDDAARLAAGVNTAMGPVTPQAVQAVTNKPLSSLVSVSLPGADYLGEFGKNFRLDLGTGKTAQAIANRASNAKDWALYSKAGRAVSPLFDARLSEFGAPGSSEAVQRNTRAASDALALKKFDIMGQHIAERNVVADAGIDMADPTQAKPINEAMRQYVEGYKPTAATLPPQLEDMGVAQIQELMARREAAKKAGRLAPTMADDPASHFPRGLTKDAADTMNDPTLRASLGPINPNDIRRESALTNVPLGTAGGENPLLATTAKPLGGLNQLFEDPLTKAVPGVDRSLENRAKYTRRKYLGMSKEDELKYNNLQAANWAGQLPKQIPGPRIPYSPNLSMIDNPDYLDFLNLSGKVKQSRELVGKSTSDITKAYNEGLQKAVASGLSEKDWAKQVRKKFADQGYAPFQNSPLADIHSYRLADEKSNAAAGAVMDTIKQSLSPTGGDGFVPLKDVLVGSGYDNANARALLLGKKAGATIKNWFVPADVAADLTKKAASSFEIPSWFKPIASAFDSITNLNKKYQTMFPSTMARNLGGEGYINLANKTGNIIKDSADVARVRAGVSPGLPAADSMALFHGTPYQFGEFDLNKAQASTGLGGGKGFFFSPDESLARGYSQGAHGATPGAGTPRVVPINVPKGKLLDLTSPEALALPKVANVDDLIKQRGYAGFYSPGGDHVLYDPNPFLAKNNMAGGIESLSHLPDFHGLSPAEALKKLNEEMFQFGIEKPQRAAMDEIIGRGARDANPGTLAPISQKKSLVDAAKNAWQDIKTGASQLTQPGGMNPMNWSLGSENPLNPVGMAGVGGRSESTNAVAKLGEQAMTAADEYGRKGAYIGLRKQGYAPEVAAKMALDARMDPSRLAPFEKQVMRRLMPFYSWSRQNIPQMLGNIASEPGGLVAQSIRGTNAVRQNEGLMPDYLGEGVAMPVGARGEDGTQRYLTSLGLPFEDLHNIASTGPHAIQRTFQKAGAMLNPLFKNPIEAMTGKQLYSGRDLADLYARSGSPTVDGLIGMTPLQRPLNVASTLTDPRKGLLGAATNVLSPGRISDVDMNRAAQIQGRRLLEEELRGNPLVREHTDLYVPADQRANMTPEELQLMSLYRTLLQRARQQRPATTP